MDSTRVDNEAGKPGKERASMAWTTLREFLLLTLIISGGFALTDLYKHGQSIREYLLGGAFISAFIVLGGLIRVRWQRILKSKTYLPPGN